MAGVLGEIAAKFNYWAYAIILCLGLWALMVKNNLIKKIIGLSMFQTAVILFYISTSVKRGADIPILVHEAGHGHADTAIRAADYLNPLPHVLMLTAIVVSVATLGVALALAIRLYDRHKTLEEDEILKELRD